MLPTTKIKLIRESLRGLLLLRITTDRGNGRIAYALPFVMVVALLSMSKAMAVPRIKSFQIAVNKSRIVHLTRNTDEISVGNPDIADIRLVSPRELYLLGHRLGTTNVSLGSKDAGFYETLEVEVTHDLNGLKAKLHELLPGEHPKVFSSQGAIVLGGEVSSAAKADAILQIANTYIHQAKQGSGGGLLNVLVGDEKAGAISGQSNGSPQAAKGQQNAVINLMQIGGPQQVMLEVKVAEMNRVLAKNLNVNFDVMRAGGPWAGGAVAGRANIPSPITDFNGNIIPISERITDGGQGGQSDQLFRSVLDVFPGRISPFGLFSRFVSNSFNFNAVINAARNNGVAKILAEPTLTTISGQEANFLSGGEFPIPVLQGGGGATGGITIEYKKFGVITNFVPVVLDSGRISLKLDIEVSERQLDNTVNLSVPNTDARISTFTLLKRNASSSVELSDGQTIGIAGLISDSLRENINKLPGIGELPVLGQLFTSQQFLKNQTELVIFVTPRLARPMPTSAVKLPTDSFVEPDDIEYYLMGRTESRKEPLLRHTPAEIGGGVTGTFGQDLNGAR